jgi:hypothetical protein
MLLKFRGLIAIDRGEKLKKKIMNKNFKKAN